MRTLFMWLLLGSLCAVRAWAADAPPVATPRTHNSACSLAESMASKLGTAHVEHGAAQHSCEALAPTMSPADHAEFMRCCTKTLETGVPAGKPAPKSAPGHNPAQSM